MCTLLDINIFLNTLQKRNQFNKWWMKLFDKSPIKIVNIIACMNIIFFMFSEAIIFYSNFFYVDICLFLTCKRQKYWYGIFSYVIQFPIMSEPFWNIKDWWRHLDYFCVWSCGNDFIMMNVIVVLETICEWTQVLFKKN
jgi:hypothetical protein